MSYPAHKCLFKINYLTVLYLHERSRYSSNTTGQHGQRANLAPQNMQWAIRSSRESGSRTGQGVRLPNGSNWVFIDPSSLRRSSAAAAAANGAAVAAAAGASEPITMATTASCLARAFGKLISILNAVYRNTHNYFHRLHVFYILEQLLKL